MKTTPYQYLRTKYPAEEYVLISEVSDSSWRNRSLDFMVVNLWESRGLAIIGIELKSYRSDWLRELKNPAKQERHVPFCDYFYLFTMDESVAKMEEIPDNWGWMTVRGGKIFTLKKAPKQESKPIPKSLMVSMLRRAADKQEFVHKNSIQDEINAKITSALERKSRERDREFESMKEHYESIKKSIKAFEEESGVKFPIDSWGVSSSKNFGKAVNFVLNNDVNALSNRLTDIQNIAKKILDAAGNSLTEFEKLKTSEEL